MSQVIDICFGKTYLNVEQQNEEDKDDQSKSLHGVGFTKSAPFNTEIGDVVANKSENGC